MLVAWCWLALALAPAPALADACTYSLRSTVTLAAGARADVAYRLQGALSVRAAAPPRALGALPAGAELLLFTVEGVHMSRRGAAPHAEFRRRPSPWDARPARAALALRQDGRLLRLFLPADAADAGEAGATGAPDADGYLRALVSLFQYRREPGVRAERDVSGDCEALYETLEPTVFRKIKRACAWEQAGPWEARRVARYTLRAPDAAWPARVHAEEVVRPRGAAAGDVRARSWHELELSACRADVPPAAPPHAMLEAPLPLPLPPEDRLDLDFDDDDDEPQDLTLALERGAAALGGGEPGAGGGVGPARALPALLRALRRASGAELRAALHAPRWRPALPGLCRALGLAGGEPAWAAARDLLAPHAKDALAALAPEYFAGLALSDAPHPDVVAEALRLGEEAPLPEVARAALLGGAAAVPRLPAAARAEPCARLAAALARCRDADAACRALRCTALGNARCAEAAGALLVAAERAADGAAEAALRALRRLPLSAGRARRAGALARAPGRALAERWLAAELGAERAPDAAAARAALGALDAERGAAAAELARALRGRLEALGAAPAGALRPRWDAARGTSLVLRRALGWGAAAGGAGPAALDAALLAAGGVLRRARVALQADEAPPDEAPPEDLLTVEVWTRGLDALAGSADADADAEPGAGLQLSVAGAALPPVHLFSGRAELLAHVWSGTAAEPRAALRALRPGAAGAGVAPLAAGVPLRARWARGAALALDAHGTASLWSRTARAGLRLRAAGHARVALAAGGAGAELRARAELQAAPRLAIDADLDFYDGVALCARARVAPHAERWTARLEERDAGGAARRARSAVLRREGRTLSLSRENDAACRVLRAAESDEPDEPDEPDPL